jgi:hypothetical protein
MTTDEIIKVLENLPKCSIENGNIVADRDAGSWIYWLEIERIIKKIKG